MTKFIEVTTTGDYDIFINVNNILDIAREKGTNNAIITLAVSDNQEYFYIVPDYDEIIKRIKVLCGQSIGL